TNGPFTIKNRKPPSPFPIPTANVKDPMVYSPTSSISPPPPGTKLPPTSLTGGTEDVRIEETVDQSVASLHGGMNMFLGDHNGIYIHTICGGE
ncbi:hypothetical protein ACJ72_08722, partial [Emergomyces africanus]